MTSVTVSGATLQSSSSCVLSQPACPSNSGHVHHWRYTFGWQCSKPLVTQLIHAVTDQPLAEQNPIKEQFGWYSFYQDFDPRREPGCYPNNSLQLYSHQPRNDGVEFL